MPVVKNFNLVSIFANLILGAALVVSCVADKKTNPDPAGPHIDLAAQTAKEVGVGMGKAADNIDKHVGTIATTTPKEVRTKIQPELTGITDNTSALRVLKGKLDTVQSDLDVAKKNNADLEKRAANLEQDNAKLKREKDDALHRLFMWLTVGSVVGLGVCGALFFTGNKWGITGGIACLITLGVSVFVAQYTAWFAVGVGVVGIGVVGLIIYELWKRHHVAQQLVQTVEASKMAMREPARRFLFGNGPVSGKVDHDQSPTTKKFVKQLRDTQKVKTAPSLHPVEIQ
jgi:membrane-bound ClpP family serine protease